MVRELDKITRLLQVIQSSPGAVQYIILKIQLLLGGVRSIYPLRLNEGFGSLLPHTYQMLPDEGCRVQQPKRINNNQDEDRPNHTTQRKLLTKGSVGV